MTEHCERCGSEKNVQIVYDYFTPTKYSICSSCAAEEFAPGSRIVRFTDRSSPYYASCYLHIKSENDLEDVLLMGERAQKIGSGSIQSQTYTVRNNGKRMAPTSVSFGTKGSIIDLHANLDRMRVWLTASKIVRSHSGK
ncbi:MAG: hypothetical protein JSW61_11425 [Candidatus Thorarchaeota archaeon]|nr:MAG: hypothetical protein JSW61_11425 [Candidatus Thorarchaeota archaeon]